MWRVLFYSLKTDSRCRRILRPRAVRINTTLKIISTSLARTLIGRESSDDGAKAVHDLFGRKDLPDVLFWEVLAFWRSDRDV